MSISLSVAFSAELPVLGRLGRDHAALGDGFGRLDGRLRRANFVELQSFVSADSDDLSELLDLADDGELPPEQWYPAADGLAAIRAAIEHVEADASALPGVREDVLDDLRSVEAELLAAEAKGVAFHFCLLD